ncbi:hypothetical protein [Wolbachia endosymbiont (group B) of Ennomos erosarius]|uniref:hypothetical protein n=1 Tax=Wolbachia endosymbiont (group B) of Ennomos erosarius TaxID=3066175 RepID=UPI003132AA59
MVNLICFFITAEFTLFSCLFYSPLIQNSRYWFKIKHNIRKISHMFADFFNAVYFILKNVSTFVD